MNRRIFLVVLIVGAGICGWILAPRGTEGAGDAGPPPLDAAVREPAPPVIVEKVATTTPRTIAEPQPAPIDTKTRDRAHVIVQDRLGSPIANADIRMTGLRTKRDPSARLAWPEEPSTGRTGLDGTATLWFPVRATGDDEAGELTFEVSHPDFVTQTVDDFAVGPEPRVVVLEHGTSVVVSGWIRSPEEVITAVVPHLTWDVELAQDAWRPIRDGRLSTANLPPGEHALYLSHSSAERGEYFSEVERFSLAEAEQKEIRLRLHPAATLEGVVEDEVPRPVRNGSVLLNLRIRESGSRQAGILLGFSAPIREDGTFTIAGLPPGDGRIIALCTGWASERGELASSAQRADPAAGGRFALEMEPTGSLRATLRGPDGAPVAGATLSCRPNVFWLASQSSTFQVGEWSATSDAKGDLAVTNLPSGTTWLVIEHPGLDLPSSNGDRTRQATIESGKTTEVALELVAKEK